MLLLFAAGALLPALGGLWRWSANYLALQRLRPLWLASVAAAPQVVLGDPPSRLRDLFTVRGVDLRLYRRIIEIKDARWQQGITMDAPEAGLAEQARALLKGAGSVVVTPVGGSHLNDPDHNDPPDATAPQTVNMS
jgi:hypothetical protein